MKIINKIIFNNNIYDIGISSQWGFITGDVSKQTDLINIPYQNNDYKGISTIKEALDMLLYSPLKINSFNIDPSKAETGEVIKQIDYTWSYNKSIKNQYLKIDKDILLNINDRKYSYKGDFTSNVTGTLISEGTTEKPDDNARASATFCFYPGIYYGTSATEISNSKLIYENFNRLLTSSKTLNIEVNALANKNEFIYICIPKYFINQEVIFNVGGFTGGFELKNNNFKFNRYPNTIIDYFIYKSEESGLGVTKININIK